MFHRYCFQKAKHRFNSIRGRFLHNSHANKQIVNKEVSKDSLVVGGAGGLI